MSEIVDGKRWMSLIIVLLFSIAGYSQEYKDSQNKVKAIYLYNFIKNIEWNNNSSEGFRICLLEKDDFYTDLEKLIVSKKKGTRSILVEEIAVANACKKCDLVFLDEKQTDLVAERSPDCAGLFVTSGFYKKSFSDIALLYNENKLHFSINTDLCAKNGFKVPSQLLLLANQKLIHP